VNNPKKVIILCRDHGKVLLNEEQNKKFYDVKDKLAGLCPLCNAIPKAIYPCKKIEEDYD